MELLVVAELQEQLLPDGPKLVAAGGQRMVEDAAADVGECSGVLDWASGLV